MPQRIAYIAYQETEPLPPLPQHPRFRRKRLAWTPPAHARKRRANFMTVTRYTFPASDAVPAAVSLVSLNEHGFTLNWTHHQPV
jgi:hypothetical protein